MSTLPSDTPRLPKWPFLVADAALLGIAVVLALRSGTPFSPGIIFGITGCVALAAILGAIPFLADYAASQDEALDDRQRSLDALTRTVANSAEQISVAANSLHELSELSRQQLQQAKAIPEKLTVELETLKNEQNESLTDENRNLQKELKSLRSNEAKKLAELTEKIQQAIKEIEKIKLAPSPAPSEPKKNRAPKPKPVETDPQTEAELTFDEASPATKSAADDPDQSVASKDPEPTPPPEIVPDPIDQPAEGEAGEKVDPELSLDASEGPKADHRISPDGMTRLLVSAYIGIGNRLFVRGTGAGLSEDKGVPLQFVSIGKWQWETSEATETLKVRLYKNDEIECTALGEITVDPGSQSTVSATF